MKRSRIPRAVREQAAVICSMRASADVYGYPLVPFSWSAAYRLAGQATAVASELFNLGEWREMFAEAEALLRCGWSPP